MPMLKLFTVGLAVFASNSVLASEECTENCVTKIVADFRGKPPFKRTIEVLPAVDIAVAEVVTSDPVWVDVKSVDFKGKPPFKRRQERLEQTEVMQAEISSEAASSKRRSRARIGSSILKRH